MTLKDYIKKKGYMRKTLAETLGVNPQTITNYMDKPQNIPIKNSLKLCEFIHIDFLAFARGKVKPFKYKHPGDTM